MMRQLDRLREALGLTAGYVRRRLRRQPGDTGAWLAGDRILACAYPRRTADLARLRDQGVSLLLNLHRHPHDPASLTAHGLREVRLPVRDFTAPRPEQIAAAVATLDAALAAGERVAVHCGAGLGRTGTILACYLVRQGADPTAAIAELRRLRPGSVETASQVAAVTAYAATLNSAVE